MSSPRKQSAQQQKDDSLHVSLESQIASLSGARFMAESNLRENKEWFVPGGEPNQSKIAAIVDQMLQHSGTQVKIYSQNSEKQARFVGQINKLLVERKKLDTKNAAQ